MPSSAVPPVACTSTSRWWGWAQRRAEAVPRASSQVVVEQGPILGIGDAGRGLDRGGVGRQRGSLVAGRGGRPGPRFVAIGEVEVAEPVLEACRQAAFGVVSGQRPLVRSEDGM